MEFRVSILTASDRCARKERPDISGKLLEEFAGSEGWVVIHREIVSDEQMKIRELLIAWADQDDQDIILVTGGTGFSARDVTPEATQSVIDREAPGLAEAMRNASRNTTPHAMLSRAVAGIRGRVLIVNLPGSPQGAIENLKVIWPVLPHAVELLRGSPESEKHNPAPRG